MQYVKYTKCIDNAKELQNYMTNNVFWTHAKTEKKHNNNNNNKTKSEHKNPFQSRELNPGIVAPQLHTLPLTTESTEHIV